MADFEWWTSPGEADRRLDLLTQSYQLLYLATQSESGRAQTPEEIQKYAKAEYEAFQRWRVAVVSSWFEMLVWSSYHGELEAWGRRYNRLRDLCWANGNHDVPAPMNEWRQPTETVFGKLPTDDGLLNGGTAIGLGVFALAGLYLTIKALR